MSLPHENGPRSTDLRRRLFQIQKLAAIPQVVWQVMEALADDRTDAARLERIIESDPALATKVLSLANSTYFRRLQKITTINRAIFVIGFDELEFLAMGAGLAGFFDMKKIPAAFNGRELWRHSLAVSWTARVLAQACDYDNPAEILLAGLLHDLGKLVLMAHLKKEMDQLQELVDSGLPYYQAEENLDLKHAHLGYWLAKRWGLPEIHSTVIRDHHTPRPESPHYRAVCLVALADDLVKDLQIGLVNEARPRNLAALMTAVRLTPKRWQALIEEVKDRLPGGLETMQNLLA